MSNLYFAYGSNLDQNQMIERCPNSNIYGFGVLLDSRLCFEGYSVSRKGSVCSIEDYPGAYLEGVLYALDDSDLRSLDKYEGYPKTYDRSLRTVITDGGLEIEAWVYKRRVKMGEDLRLPSEEYLSLVYGGYRRYGFNLRNLHEAYGRVRHG